MQWPWQKPTPPPIQPPKVGGTRAPDQVVAIDFTKPHNFHFRFSSGGEQVFRGCILVGFSTPTDGSGNRLGRGSGEFGEWGHDRWLVLRHRDGHLAYVPREALQFIEESLTDQANL
jgi:hypothetical protein